jgi:hypothetical protein
VAIAAQWQTVASVTTTAGTVYTTNAATASTFGYGRDLVVTNSGTVTIFIGMGASNVATSVASFGVPSGGTLVLTQCGVPNATPVTAIAGAGTGQVSIGYATNVAYV